jgi:hypothetical protein
MVVLSTGIFDAPPFQHVVCHGVLLGAMHVALRMHAHVMVSEARQP